MSLVDDGPDWALVQFSVVVAVNGFCSEFRQFFRGMPRLAYLLCRPTVKVILFSVFLVLCFVFWSGCNLLLPIHEATTKRLAPSATECEKYLPKATQEPAAATEEVEPITCPKNEHYGDLEVRVNGEKKVGGLRETTTNKDYVPFSFVKDYFEIFGEPTIEKGKNVLIWRHTTSEIRKPSAKYNPTGPFLWFDHYRVEGRMRVKCISGIESVPVSIQWDPEGYFYPIQIAQYGLSHYSMFLLEDKSNRGEKLFDDGETPADETWLFRKETIQVENVFDEEISSRVISFSSNGKSESDRAEKTCSIVAVNEKVFVDRIESPTCRENNFINVSIIFQATARLQFANWGQEICEYDMNASYRGKYNNAGNFFYV